MAIIFNNDIVYILETLHWKTIQPLQSRNANV